MDTKNKLIAGAVGAVAIGALSVWGTLRFHETRGAKGEAQAQQFKAQATVTQTRAQIADARIPALTAKTAALAKQLATASAQRDEALKKLDEREAAAPLVPDERDEVIAKDKVVIEEQAQKIDSLAADLSVTTEARDQWKATADLREKQAMAQEAATNAWKKAVKESRWQGRGEGALAGVIVGLLARR